MKIFILLFPGGPQSNDAEIEPCVKSYLSKDKAMKYLIRSARICGDNEDTIKMKELLNLNKYEEVVSIYNNLYEDVFFYEFDANNEAN